MDGRESDNSSSFSLGKSARERGLSYVPGCYMVPPSQRSNLTSQTTTTVPVVDLAGLHGGGAGGRSQVIKDIATACRRHGFFQIINHGISQSVLDGALSSASDFFNLPMEEKLKLMSNDVHKPVRYGTSLKDGIDKVQFWRVFLKHYAHPLKDWVESWPENPATYRHNMGRYATEVRNLALDLTEAITESLGIGPTNLTKKMEDGVQVLVINRYPACPKPELALGLPPHSDYSCLTILLQSCQGLEIMDMNDGGWRGVPEVGGALQVHVGDHFEVLSNGLYKSVMHRATLNGERTRISVASFHSLGMDEKMETATELIDEQHPKGYKGSSFRDFLNFLSANDIAQGNRFIQTLKI